MRVARSGGNVLTSSQMLTRQSLWQSNSMGPLNRPTSLQPTAAVSPQRGHGSQVIH
ncbi:protein of unknown function [Blastococcus saxobsidens DD2]|uniref:Uncharacterized protein n=1 Tax=Blastococcus saxobsidens (strain DD2) TaxID=1146883 RepID=H6RNN6_BLASD|nr:protein of unknown function [Blastococcus saxobsidens DD2]